MPLLLLLGLLAALPLTMPSEWEVLEYRRIPPNALRFNEGGLTISVRGSASPIVHALAGPTAVAGVRGRGRIAGRLDTTPARQGEQGHDDFALRIGLVQAGTRRPTFLERRLAPGWVRRLFALAPPGTGIQQIRFFNVGLDASQIGWTRRHPLSDLLLEEVVAVPDREGRFEIHLDFAPVDTLAVWLAADGDDSGSTFEVHLEALTLIPATRGTVP
ncbi:MAG: hypothetical protein Q8L86_18925 [Vicinamibacterales bacterium]|nr:hypothetical protein [Vicinamibacterales bacterium]